MCPAVVGGSLRRTGGSPTGLGRSADPHVPTGVGRRGGRRLRPDRAAEPVAAGAGDGLLLHRDGAALGGSYEDVLSLLTDGWRGRRAKSRSPCPRSRRSSRPVHGWGPSRSRSCSPRVALPWRSGDAGSVVGRTSGGRHRRDMSGCGRHAENSALFGRPGVNKGEQAAFPQARVVAVAECGTHAIFDATVGKYTTAENTMAGELIDRLAAGDVAAGRPGVLRVSPVVTGRSHRCRLLWRAMPNMKPRPIETLADGSWLAELRPSGNAGRKATPLTIRVIDYRIDDGRTTRSPTGSSPPSSIPTTSPLWISPPPTAALGDRERVRRAEDPPARPSHRAAIEVARPRAPRDLGSPLLPLRHPHPHVGGRRPGGGRPRPGQLRRRSPHRSPLDLSGARFFPLRLTTVGATPSPCSSDGSTRLGDCDPTRGSSSASTSSGT